MNPDQKIEICKKTRLIAQKCLVKAIETILKNKQKISEVEFRNRWIKELQKNEVIFKEGWYAPPPYGVGVLMGKDQERTDHKFRGNI